MTTRSILEIDLNIIRQNYLEIKKLTKSEVAASVKADAYGLGATHIVKLLQKENCKKYFVANIKEALHLRKKFPNIDIFILDGFFKQHIQTIIEYRITPVISNLYQIEILNDYCAGRDIHWQVALHIETGMNRLALIYDDVEKIITNKVKTSHIEIKYVISHLASSDIPESQLNITQLKEFIRITKYFPGTELSLANTSGLFLGEKYHFDFIRPGAGIYGINPVSKMRFCNPVRLFCPLLQVKLLAKGSSLGYNQTYVANQETWVGTIGFGYADGMLRSLGNKGSCYINGHKAPIIGAVSMDLTNIDLTLVPEKDRSIGQDVDIICLDQSADDVARDANTIGYEILSRLGNRNERIYKK
ncbi:MAG: alanine racemase [Rickettsiaceae bacterium]|nr:alanine racemase [Rickettsiaceae bacterium]